MSNLMPVSSTTGTQCYKCHKSETVVSRCAQCHSVMYCSKVCQTADWKDHKPTCKRIAAELKSIQQVRTTAFGPDKVDAIIKPLQVNFDAMMRGGYQPASSKMVYEEAVEVSSFIPMETRLGMRMDKSGVSKSCVLSALGKDCTLPGDVLALGGAMSVEAYMPLSFCLSKKSGLDRRMQIVDLDFSYMPKFCEFHGIDDSLFETVQDDIRNFVIGENQYAIISLLQVVRYLPPSQLEDLFRKICSGLTEQGIFVCEIASNGRQIYPTVFQSSEDALTLLKNCGFEEHKTVKRMSRRPGGCFDSTVFYLARNK